MTHVDAEMAFTNVRHEDFVEERKSKKNDEELNKSTMEVRKALENNSKVRLLSDDKILSRTEDPF